jgi:exosome complex component RRP45
LIYLKKKRLDKRQIYDVRETKIEFFKTRGACIVSSGETKVSAQVSSEILKPKETRPNEGLLRINLELSPMAAQHFEPNK